MSAPARVGDGKCSVTTAGTAVNLATAGTFTNPGGAIQTIVVTARPGNTGKIAVGGSTVVAAAGNERGVILAAGAAVSIDTDDIGDLWIDATVSGEGVAFAWVA